MADMCGDNRFEVIEKAKEALLKETNVESSPKEMEVLGNFLFRCWQMGWLNKYEPINEDELDKESNMLQLIKKDGTLYDEQNRMVFDMSSSRDNNEAVTKVTMEYTQEQDCASSSDEPNVLELSTECDGYYVLKTERWAFDSPEDMMKIINDFCSRFTNIAWLNKEDYEIKEEKL